MPESKSDFSDIILTKEEIEGIHRLQDITEDHKDRIPGFDGLRSARFVTLAHPKSIKSDGYGGYTSDEIYKQAEKYFQETKNIIHFFTWNNITFIGKGNKNNSKS